MGYTGQRNHVGYTSYSSSYTINYGQLQYISVASVQQTGATSYTGSNDSRGVVLINNVLTCTIVMYDCTTQVVNYLLAGSFP